jgi:N-acetyl-anhydromuramyl-L-alanine amidase AmpD
MKPEGIVYHGMGAQGADEIGLDNSDPFDVGVCVAILKHYKVSAHVLVARDGTPYQLVPFENEAYHAGVSLLTGRPHCNEWCLSIEFQTVMGKNTKQYGPAYTDAEIRTGLAIRDFWMNKYGIPLLNTGGHREVRDAALKAGMRKTDGSIPGPKWDPGSLFPWEIFYQSGMRFYGREAIASQEKIIADRRAAKERNQTVPVMPDGS